MHKQKTLLILTLVVIIFVAIFNYIGIKYNLYWIYKWYDIPMHLLGGFCVGLFSLFLYKNFNKNISIVNYRRKVFVFVFLILLFVTVSWEIFELIGGITFLTDKGYWLDNIGDIMNGLLGGIVAYLFFIRNKKCNTKLGCINNQNNKIIK